MSNKYTTEIDDANEVIAQVPQIKMQKSESKLTIRVQYDKDRYEQLFDIDHLREGARYKLYACIWKNIHYNAIKVAEGKLEYFKNKK